LSSLNKEKKILGISCFYHDSSAVLIINGVIDSAAQEERFTRIKHDKSFPSNAIKFCLKNANLNLEEIDSIVYYEKPLLTFERLLETYLGTAPRGLRSFIAAMQVWIKEKLFIKSNLKKDLQNIQKEISFQSKNIKLPPLLFSEHHLSHAASAFYPSPFKEAVILCMDGVGEWATTSAWLGKNEKISPLWEISFPHSLGLLYSAFTYYCGFKVNSGEYKLMGLAPYGTPKYVDKIKKYLIDIKKDGSFKLNMKFFSYHNGLKMTSDKFNKIFKNKPRKAESKITQFHMDLAASIQVVTEEVVLLIAKNLKKETGLNNLCFAGGVALNCVANGKLLKEKIFDNIWIQPAAGDAGTALGAALYTYYDFYNNERTIDPNDSMKGSYLGPKFSNREISDYLTSINAVNHFREDMELYQIVADELIKGSVIGWFNGPMEFGPRALGARSIIGDPRNKNMQSKMNLKIKYRESFRPFAPSILEEELETQFNIGVKSPYMLLVANVREHLCKKMTHEEEKLFGIEKLNISRSSLPAITHVDYSARIQTVNKITNKKYYELIKTFQSKTNCPTVVNTSFNVRGEPIVCTPQDAFRCFMRTEMDVLVLENHILYKNEQEKQEKDETWMQNFELD